MLATEALTGFGQVGDLAAGVSKSRRLTTKRKEVSGTGHPG